MRPAGVGSLPARLSLSSSTPPFVTTPPSFSPSPSGPLSPPSPPAPPARAGLLTTLAMSSQNPVRAPPTRSPSPPLMIPLLADPQIRRKLVIVGDGASSLSSSGPAMADHSARRVPAIFGTQAHVARLHYSAPSPSASSPRNTCVRSTPSLPSRILTPTPVFDHPPTFTCQQPSACPPQSHQRLAHSTRSHLRKLRSRNPPRWQARTARPLGYRVCLPVPFPVWWPRQAS